MTETNAHPTVQIGNTGRDISGNIAGGNINQYNYNLIPPAPVDPETLAKAQTRLQSLPADHLPEPAPLPKGSRMPHARNPLFTGRQADLLTLARRLKQGNAAAIGQIAAAAGLGGIGKTQLAIEFVHRYGQFFSGGVYWLSFADADGVPAEIAACAQSAGAPGVSSLPLPEQVNLVLQNWQSPLPRLLIFDNCEDQSLLEQWRPTSGGARVLLTTRRGKWSAELGVQVLPLDVLPRPESIALLQKYRPALRPADADPLAAELGDLPLALQLAGSYLRRYAAVNPAEYLQELQNEALLQHPSMQGRGAEHSPTGHELHVARTFALSYNKLSPANSIDALALALLARAAHFAPGEAIPRGLLLKTIHHSPFTVHHSPLDFEDALRRLLDLGLLQEDEADALALHRLLAQFARAAADDAALAAAQQDVEETLLAEARRLNNAGFPFDLLPLQPHLRHVTEAALPRRDETAANLGNTLGYHLPLMGDYKGAKPYYERALEIRQEALGSRHPDTATSLNNLGGLLSSMGDYEGAKPYYERALEIRQEALGSRHPDTATSLNNLAVLHANQGNFQEAARLMRRALDILEAVLGSEHPHTQTARQSLAAIGARL